MNNIINQYLNNIYIEPVDIPHEIREFIKTIINSELENKKIVDENINLESNINDLKKEIRNLSLRFFMFNNIN